MKTREERLSILRTEHDAIKEHPFWITMDDSLFKDLIGHYRTILNNIWNSSDESNPYYVVLRCVKHDMNTMLYKLYCDEKPLSHYLDKGDIIMVLQVFLQNVHALIDGHKPWSGGNVVAYAPYGGEYLKYQAFQKEDGTWQAYNIRPDTEKERNIVRKKIERYLHLRDEDPMKKWATAALSELESGAEIVGECWKFKK